MGPTDGTGSLAGLCPPLSARELALFFQALLRLQFVITLFRQGTCFAPSRREELALFRTLRSSGSGTGDPAGLGPSRPARGNWLCLYQRSRRRLRRRPRPSASAAVVPGKLASFRTHWFGVPRLRGSDRSFPPQGGTPNGPGYLWASVVDLRRGCVLGRSRRNPPKSWSLVCHPLFCCPVIIRARQFLVK